MSERTMSDFSDETRQNANKLKHQVTLHLSSDQYERLFFQPNSAKGDLSKRLGNPTLLGLLGFLIPFTVTMYCLCGFQGTGAIALASTVGQYYFYGGIAMVLAGIAHFILGNTYPMTIFIVYGTHWLVCGYTDDPAHPLAMGFAAGERSPEFNAGLGLYYVVMTIVTTIFMIGSIRVNIPFVIVWVMLVFVFAFSAEGYFETAHNQTAGGASYATKMFKVAGSFGFVATIVGWYLCIIAVCASTGVPCPLPIFDLSSKVFANDEEAIRQEHAGYSDDKNQ